MVTVDRTDERYPSCLGELRSPPVPLYLDGNHEALELRAVAIVGSRVPTESGSETFAYDLAKQLAHRGYAVASGLARGIDAAAHAGALDAHGPGTTVAVLGCGIDRAYPRANHDLFRRILAEGGCIVSEYGPGTEPAPWRFLARNRIVAALADAVVVVDAHERSGSLVTADFASELRRPLFVRLGTPGTDDLFARNLAVPLVSDATLAATTLDDAVAAGFASWMKFPATRETALYRPYDRELVRFHVGDRVTFDPSSHLRGTVVRVEDFDDELGTNQLVTVEWLPVASTKELAQDLHKASEENG